MKSIKKIIFKSNRDLKRKFHKTNLLYTHSVQNEFKTKVEAYSILLHSSFSLSFSQAR